MIRRLFTLLSAASRSLPLCPMKEPPIPPWQKPLPFRPRGTPLFSTFGVSEPWRGVGEGPFCPARLQVVV
jgi:hypothetical protein